MNFDIFESDPKQEICAQFQPSTVDQLYDIRRPTIIAQNPRTITYYDGMEKFHRQAKAVIAHHYDYLVKNNSHREFAMYMVGMMNEIQQAALDYSHEDWQSRIARTVLFHGLCDPSIVDNQSTFNNYQLLSSLKDNEMQDLIMQISLLLTHNAQRASGREIKQKKQILYDYPIISQLDFSVTDIAWFPIVREFGLINAMVPRVKDLLSSKSKFSVSQSSREEFINDLVLSYEFAAETAFNVGYFQRVRTFKSTSEGTSTPIAFACPARDFMKSTGLNIALNRYLMLTVETERRVPLLEPDGMYLKSKHLLSIFKQILEEVL